MSPTLNELFEKYKSVDCTYGTDKITSHSYGELYSNALSNYSKHVVLEIGYYSGSSMVVWSEFFPESIIYGIDISLDKLSFGKELPNIKHYLLDGTIDNAPEKLNELKGNNDKYDIIIEDASHTPESQVKTFELFGPTLNKGGVYIIEDINEIYADQVKSGLEILVQNYSMRMEWHDLRHIKNRFDDIVAVIYN